MWEMIKAEFRHIRRNRLLLISAIVICFIPFLYSIFFLKSVWDPYGSTQDLPVAVVNKDVPVDYQGKEMAVGDQMVKELKHNNQLDWKFVSPSEAKYGMSHRKYYTVITIPENFSKNATTVLEKNPKPMNLKYTTNDSLNYIGYVMSQVAMTKLNEKVRANVTNAYATAMFKELKVLGKGMTQAADGATQLDNGLVTLQSGANQYVAGVSQVNNGVQTLKMGVAPLAAGAQQLASGSATLQNGIAQYTGGVGQLAGGLGQLNEKTGEVQTGIGKLAAGTNLMDQKLNGMLPELSNQMNQMAIPVQQSAGQLNTALQNVQTNQKNAVDSLNQILAGLNAMKQVMSQQPAAQSTQPANNNKAALDSLNGIDTKGMSPDAIAKLNQAKSQLSNSAAPQTRAASPAPTAQLDQLIAGVTALRNAMQDPKQNGSAAVAVAAQNLTKSLTDMQTNSSTAINKLGGELTTNVGLLNDGANELNNKFGLYSAGVAKVKAGASQLTANSGALNAGAGQLAGALGQLNGQVPTLVSGVNQLAAGTQQLVNNSPALIQGITKLNAGAGQLATALDQGAKTVNGIKPTKKTAKMIAEPTAVKHKSYSYVPNYGHALAPYVLSVALYVGALIFNFVYPIRRVAIQGRSPLAWWASKVVLGSLIITLMALAEGGIMMALGLTVDHVPSFFTTLVLFGLASMAVVMFLSMTFDNPGRFVAMVLLMLQLGGSGGTFPMEVTMKFYNVIHFYLPMTYSILGLRNGISGGLGEHYVAFCNSVLAGITVVFFLLLLVSMYWLQHHHFAGKSELDNNQELLGEEKDDDGMHLQDRDQTV